MRFGPPRDRRTRLGAARGQTGHRPCRGRTPELATDANGVADGAWSLEPRHIIGARHVLTHYDIRRGGRSYGRLPAGEDLRALLRALMAVLPPEEREAIVHELAAGPDRSD